MRLQHSLDLDEVRHLVGPDPDTHCLKRFSAKVSVKLFRTLVSVCRGNDVLNLSYSLYNSVLFIN